MRQPSLERLLEDPLWRGSTVELTGEVKEVIRQRPTGRTRNRKPETIPMRSERKVYRVVAPSGAVLLWWGPMTREAWAIGQPYGEEEWVRPEPKVSYMWGTKPKP